MVLPRVVPFGAVTPPLWVGALRVSTMHVPDSFDDPVVSVHSGGVVDDPRVVLGPTAIVVGTVAAGALESGGIDRSGAIRGVSSVFSAAANTSSNVSFIVVVSPASSWDLCQDISLPLLP